MFMLWNTIFYYLFVKVAPDIPMFGTLRSLESSMNPQLTKYARETEISISLARKESRQPIFPLCPLLPVRNLIHKHLFIGDLVSFELS